MEKCYGSLVINYVAKMLNLPQSRKLNKSMDSMDSMKKWQYLPELKM